MCLRRSHARWQVIYFCRQKFFTDLDPLTPPFDKPDAHNKTASVRLGQKFEKWTRQEFRDRYLSQFDHPDFGLLADEIDKLEKIAWGIYEAEEKAPHVQKAGNGFADPEQELAVEWLNARKTIHRAQRQFEDASRATQILLISASPRTDATCPSEMAKSYRLAQQAQGVLQSEGCTVDFLDLSDLSAAYGRRIYPCKACVSTAMPLCHWPCSCYPNFSKGQILDWMNELYPRWVAAHGIMIITPVHWHQAPSGLKLMMDRLVCADGGNPDPTATSGKDAHKAKALEISGWH